MIDARWIDMSSGLFVDITTLRRNLTAKGLGLEETMMAKENHHYKYDDIFPLRDSVFEGVAVKVPFAYTAVLVEEYGVKALEQACHDGFAFDYKKGRWVPIGN